MKKTLRVWHQKQITTIKQCLNETDQHTDPPSSSELAVVSPDVADILLIYLKLRIISQYRK